MVFTILGAFTVFHVIISLIGILSGFVVVYGLLNSSRMDGWTSLFFWTTVLTSVTGFLFPVQKFLPSHVLGILSLIVLLFTYLARYRHNMIGGWRKTYVITAVIALYFNCFVLVVQLFEKVPALHELAPTQSEPPFAVAQGIVLVVFIVLGVLATKRFHPV